MSSLNPPLTKEDFIHSSWKEVIDNSESKECRRYYDGFHSKATAAKETGNHRQYEIFDILKFVCMIPVENIKDEYLDFLAEIVDEVSDPELKAKIAEILWVKRGDYRSGQLAVEAYLESAKQLEDPQKWKCCFDRIERSLRLARKINYKPEIVIEYIDEVLNRYKGEDPLWLSIKLHELLQEEKNINILRKKQLLNTSKYAALAEKGAIFAESSKEWDKARNYWEIKAEWHRIEKNIEKAYTARMLAAETYIQEAEYSLTTQPTPYSKASHYLQKAFEAFEKLKSQSTEEERTVINTRLEEIHKRLLEYQQKLSNEFRIISSEFNISDEVEIARAYVREKEFP
ncbi:hypothetical protein [Anabaena azotica]|uniref:DUF7380 domain-containing protein n=1 Tax=Anabaena azotica TaxID=197653 RepID=UPI0039A60553